MAMPNQTAERIVRSLRNEVLTLVGPPEKLHSDQGHNFESIILADRLLGSRNFAQLHTIVITQYSMVRTNTTVYIGAQSSIKVTLQAQGWKPGVT